MHTGPKGHHHLAIGHACAVVCKSTDLFEFLVEFFDFFATWTIVSKPGPVDFGLHLDSGSRLLLVALKHRLQYLGLRFDSFRHLR